MREREGGAAEGRGRGGPRGASSSHAESAPRADLRLRADAAATRCPYCHTVFPMETDGVACADCGTRHHPGCFAEHAGCSTFGCASSAADAVDNPADDLGARVEAARSWAREGSNREGLAWIRRGLAPRPCACCGEPWSNAPLVARCGCNEVMHADCYEARGACPGSICAVAPQFPVRMLTPAEARARSRNDVCASLRNLGLLFGIPLALTLIGALAVGALTLGLGLLLGLALTVCAAALIASRALRPEAPALPPAPVERAAAVEKEPSGKRRAAIE